MSQVAGQRARPVRGHRRASAPTRCASTCSATCRFGQDGSVSTEGFEQRYESELANDFGNLASRTIAMVAPLPRRRRARAPSSTRLAADFDGLPRARSRALLDRAELTDGARGDLAARAAAEPLRRGAARRGSSPRTPTRAGELDRALASLPRACASSPCCCTRTCRRRIGKLLAALGAPRRSTTTARGVRRAPARRASTKLDAALPEAPQRDARDRQPHPPRRLQARRRRARRRGRRARACTRMLTVGTNGATVPRGAARPPRSFPQVFAAIGRHPNEATGFDDADLAELQALAAHPRCVAIGETGLDYYRDYAPRADQERAFARADRARARDRQAAGHPHARGRGRHDRHAARARRRRRRDPALLLDARPPRRVPRARAGGSRSPATSPTRARRTSPRRPSACPTTGCSSRPTRRTSRRRPCARSATSRRSSCTPRASSPSARGIAYEELEAHRRAQRRAPLRLVSDAARPSRACAGCGSSASGPSATSARTSSSTRTSSASSSAPRSSAPDDVVLEIGGGLGVLSEHLAPRVRARARRRARPRARGRRCATRSTRSPTRRCTSPTRWSSTSRALDPAPTKVVANLPYGIAAGAILRTIEELPGVTRWVAMVQKEVGERFAAAPGTRRVRRAVGARPARLRRAGAARRSSRTVFHPVPNVDSVLVGLRAHRAGAGARRCASSCRARSPTGARRCRARWRWRPARRADVRDARPRGAGRARPPARRARRAPLAARTSARCAKRCALTSLTTQAPAKINLCLFLGPTRADGRHELVTRHASSLDARATTSHALERPRLGADEVVCPGVDGPNLAADALRAFRAAHRLGRPARAPDDRQAHPGRRRAWPAARPTPPPRCASPPRRRASATAACSRTSPPTLGADVPSQVRGGLVLATGAGELLEPLTCACAYGVLVVAVDAAALGRRRLRARPTGSACRASSRPRRRSRRTQAALSSETILERLHNDLQDAARSLCPAIDEALESALARGRRPRARLGLGADRARASSRRRAPRARRAASATRSPRRAGPRRRCSARPAGPIGLGGSKSAR